VTFPSRTLRLAHVTHAAGLVALLAGSARVGAQAPGDGVIPIASLQARDATVGSPTERTLLLLNLLSSAHVPSTLRPLSAHARAALVATTVDTPFRGVNGFAISPASAWIAANTTRPGHAGDGAAWRGRGLTVAAAGGFGYERGILSVSLRPMAFATQNAAFEPTVGNPIAPGDYRYLDGIIGPQIDIPYRFGGSALARVEPGESWITADTRYAGAGFSTASQLWGPATIYPVMVGPEGPGYPRLFAEIRDLPVGIGLAAVHMSVGRLESSGFSELPAGARSRRVSALVGRLQPFGLRGIELGATRFVHKRWTPASASLEAVMEPFEGIITEPEDVPSNGLGSVFLRIAPPGGGVELYGEMYREDYAADDRDLVVEPDHSSAYILGFRRAWRTADAVRAVTLESANGRFSHVNRLHGQPVPYVHNVIREGHTHRGQTLGSSALVGGGGVTARFEQVGQLSAHTVEAALRRTAQHFEGGRYDGRLSGWYELRYRRVTHGRWTNGWMAGLDFGFGDERGVNFTIERSVHWDPRRNRPLH
jgi:hypothetical protein